MTLQYEVKVVDLMISNHPHLEMFSNLKVASDRYDHLCLEYPYHAIILSEQIKKVLKIQPRTFPNWECPKGHKYGIIDGRSTIEGAEGSRYCKICGTRE